MAKHIHADLMMKAAEIAQENENWGEHFQWRENTGEEWRGCGACFSFWSSHEYRLKPRTIKIGKYDIPEPVREPLAAGQRYYIPNICMVTTSYTWNWVGNSIDTSFLENGLIHLDRESAEIHARALIALTAK
ncbi:protein of unknown function [Xenorhabdus poinarii G6]|uniref:Phage protein n=1 Tax=Xenorhabdus poinarii G6 TaxID=1354304 RepID=A0A068R277_9GAMM|nr:hypothetical protein [Xenorhabdus poinarii]CDG21026.1 protein of unknown function [Xenorhabdus poinarii G6]